MITDIMLLQRIQLALLVLGCWLPCLQAAEIAKAVYTMDEKPSCIAAGYLDVPRGQTVILQGPSKDNSVPKELSCRLMFQAQTEGDTLRMTLDSASRFEDCDVQLDLYMENSKADRVTRGCKSISGNNPILSAVNGKATVWLTRKTYDDNGYWFQVKITAERTEMAGAQDTASTGDIGKIVGITVGIIVVLVIIIIVCICCYKRRNVNEKGQENKDSKYIDKVDNSLSPGVGHGYENNMAKLSYEDSFHQSPGSDRKLLGSDQKSKSALERFGNPSARTENSDVNRQADGTPQRERHQNHGFNRNETNVGHNVGRNVPKQRVADERLERASDYSSLTDLSSLASANKPVSTQKSIPDLKSSPKPSGLRRPRENKSESNQYQPSELDRYKDGKDQDRSIQISKNLNSEKYDVAWEKSPRKPDEKRRHNEYDDYENYDRTKEREPRADKKSRNHHNHDDDSDQSEEPQRTKKKSESLDRKLDVSWEKSQRKPDEKRRHNEYDNEDNKREKGLRADKKSRNYRSQDDDDDSERMEETQRKKSERDGRSPSRDDSREHEGRFKKSASGRKPKNKNAKMGRSRSTGSALDDLYSDDGKMQPKASSVRSLSLLDDDDTELDSNYMPFKRSGSKTSLYASRSSLYGRRRKNSMGETMSMSSYALSSYVHDDLDSRVGDFDSSLLSHKEKERLFKSTGDLNVSSAIIVRECATQTGSSKEVSVYGKKTVPQRKHRKRYNRGTQTTRERRDSGASEKSARSVRSNRHLRSKSRSKESLNRRRRSKSKDLSDDDISERSSRPRRSEHKYTDDSDSEGDQYRSRSQSNQRNKDSSDRHDKRSRNKSKERSHSKQRHRDHSESEDEQSQYSSKSYETNESGGRRMRQPQSRSNISHSSSDLYQPDQNSNLHLAPDGRFPVSSGVPVQHVYQYGQQIPQFLPTGYPMVIPQPTAAFMSTDQHGNPVMIPVTSLNERAIPPKPTVPAKPNASKWDQLVNITDDMKKRRHRGGESLETESVLSSVYSQPQSHHSESRYMKTQEMQGSDRMYGSRYGDAYDAETPAKEYTVGYSRNYSATDSSV